jgi:hypothetical protein
LLSAPVGKESELTVNPEYGDDHVAEDAEGRDAAQETDDQSKAAEKFRHDGEKRQGCGNSRLVREEAHGSAKAVASKPSEDFLASVREKNDSEYEPENGEGEIAGVSSCEFREHVFVLL